MPNYYANGKNYTIPENKIDEFLIDFPNAEQSTQYFVRDKSYSIPKSRETEFFQDFPNAQTVESLGVEDKTPPKEEVKGSFSSSLVSSLYNIVGGLYGAGQATIDLVHKAGAIPQNIIGSLFNIEALKTDPKKFRKAFPVIDKIINTVLPAEIALGVAREFSSTKNFDNDIIGYIKNDDYTNAGKLLGWQVLENLPQQAIVWGTAIASGNPTLGVGVLSAQAAGAKYTDLQDREDMSDLAKFSNAISSGLTEFITEKYLGTVPILNRLQSKEFKKGVVSGIKEILKGFGQEGTEETVAQISNNLIDIATGNKDKAGNLPGIFDGVGDAALVGAVTGGILSSGGTISRNIIESSEKPTTEPLEAEKAIVPKEVETPAEAKIAQEKAIIEPDVTTRKATYTIEDGKIIKTAKGVETEVSQEEYDEVVEQQQRNKKLAQAHILEKEKGVVGEEAKKIKQDMFGVESLATLSSEDVVKYIDVIKDKEIKEIKEIPIKEVTTEKKQTLIESIQKKHGQTELRIAELKKQGLTDQDIDSVVLEDGTKYSDTVKVKREKNGALSAVITKDDIQNVKESYTKEKETERFVPKDRSLGQVLKEGAKELYQLPQTIFEKSGLKKILYDPVIKKLREATDIGTNVYNEFESAGLMKKGNYVLADRFLLSKTEKENIGKYYLNRQGRRTGVTFEKLSKRSQGTVKIFDKFIKDNEKEFFRVAHKNGIDPKWEENYAPLMIKDDIKRAGDVGVMDFVTRKNPAFFSTKERVEAVPMELYETDYIKVMTTYINKLAEFNTLGDVLPEIKYLTESEEFKEILTEWDNKYIARWVHDLATPAIEKEWVRRGLRPIRKATAIASLGLNIAPVAKQALTQIPVSIIEKAPPKRKSEFAKYFNIKVEDLPAIKQRKGNISIQDLQQGYARAVVGSLTEFDKYNARLSLNALLDKSFKKYKGEGLPLDNDLVDLVLQESQDKLDLWYGGMSKGQIPEGFRTEAGKLINMFIYPLTSQLNGFYLQIAKARGFGGKSKAIAQSLTVMIIIAYAEQVISKLAFDWGDKDEMTKDIAISLAGNIPLLGGAVYALANDQPYTPSPVLGTMNNAVKKYNKVKKDSKDMDELVFAIIEMFGLPKQIKRTVGGVKLIREEGLRDKKGKLLAPLLKGDRLRAVIRGKYGTLAVQEYLDNLGKKVENRKWTYPEVEFLQNGDYERKAEIFGELDRETRIFLYNEFSKSQKEKLKKYLKGYLKRGLR